MLCGGSLKASRKSVSKIKLGERACFIKTVYVAPCSAVRVLYVCMFCMACWSVINLCSVEGDNKATTSLLTK